MSRDSVTSSTPINPDRTADRLRLDALNLLKDRVDADAAVYFDAREVEGHLYVGTSLIVGAPKLREPMMEMRDEPMPSLLESVIRAPAAEERTQFITARQRRDLHFVGADGELLSMGNWPKRLGASDWLGLVVYSGARFVGWIGLWRLAGRGTFAPTAVHHANPLVPTLEDMLIRAHRAELEAETRSTIYLLMSPEGDVLHASPSAQSWYHDEYREELYKLTLQPGETPRYFAGMSAQVTPMHALGSERAYLITLQPANYPRIAPELVLTPTQIEVARMATSGATVDEIARMLDRSPHTVKTHLKHIYRRLDISTRVELVEVMGTVPPHQIVDF
ncbi:LuxR family transcriptional regulator [Lujinxingia sediminis]|uniref:LuxR family transcriptional regulator n=1 Tax=Lujinxingia sediminis TaxID=2480984 RepID=A0ABY0CPN4_9DELT|nr:helix-turn-helix transcriptional regulator [Lujinxingia sediminis]RVU42437.1 LuxR family transcriptional regulator [Lujinxingia sediminis]